MANLGLGSTDKLVGGGVVVFCLKVRHVQGLVGAGLCNIQILELE